MSTLPPHDAPAIFWIDGAGQQQGPEPLATVIERIAHDQIPAATPVWWQGAVNWSPFNSNAELAAALDTRLAPTPVPAADTSFGAPSGSPFGSPASDSSSQFQSPTAFESTATFAPPAEQTPAATFEAPAVFGSAATFDAPAAFQSPTPFDAPAATFDAPAPAATFDAPAPAATFDAPAPAATFDAPVQHEATAAYDTNVAVDEHATGDTPVVTDVPEIILPVETEAVSPTLHLGNTGDLDATFAELSERSAAFDAEVARAATLDDTLAGLVRHALSDLGFAIDESQTSDDYHSFRLSEPDGAIASLAIQRVPAALTVDAAVERPLACFVDRAGRASVGLFVGDYLDGDGVTDQARFTEHLASIVHAAGR